MRRLLKTIKRTVVVESIYLSKPKLAILRGLERSYKDMEIIREAVEHTL